MRYQQLWDIPIGEVEGDEATDEIDIEFDPTDLAYWIPL